MKRRTKYSVMYHLDVLEEHARTFCEILEQIDSRCMAVDGPVHRTLAEATNGELHELYMQASAVRTFLAAFIEHKQHTLRGTTNGPHSQIISA